MTRKLRLESVLTEGLAPTSLEVIDESHLHAGHGGWRPEGETHVRVRVVSAAFSGKSLVARHRMINAMAEPELRSGLHALAIEAKTPDEAALDAQNRA